MSDKLERRSGTRLLCELPEAPEGVKPLVAMVEHKGALYVATSNGLYRHNPETDLMEAVKFEQGNYPRTRKVPDDWKPTDRVPDILV